MGGLGALRFIGPKNGRETDWARQNASELARFLSDITARLERMERTIDRVGEEGYRKQDEMISVLNILKDRWRRD